ncbi:uncharacterized protein PV09_04755 [Verruconis gallopava]|uniref:Uncharacterized protein n=1 Tax=Verruconis gallopava TaxID=253628 RepID=A0A0D1YTE0_9PEZI|nr:uncharacterized protein PV09_04755 [Verruconis gallopava]KIW03912.1 hypothetical protein PV09_04755 [Verruconis gallopava]
MAADNLSLAGKTAIVTGSGRENGIGAAIATALAQNGAAVTINYVSDASEPRSANVVKTIRDLGGKAIAVRADVSVPDEAKRLVSETLKAFGTDHIDILVNNAGSGWPHSTLDISKAELEAMFTSNVFGAIFQTQATVPHMPKGGRIVNITSIASKMGMAASPMYGASKAALDSLTFTWAREVSSNRTAGLEATLTPDQFGLSKGITVNAVAPGPVMTDFVSAGEVEMDFTAFLDMTRAERRVGTAQDIADIVLLIVQEKARWMTGQYVSASGGITGQ